VTTTNNGGGKRRLKDSSLRACNKSAFNKKYLGVHKSIAYHILEFTPGSVIFKSYIINIFNFTCFNFFWEKSTLRQIPAPPDHFAQVEVIFVNEKKRILGKCHRNPRQHEF
jgi:hypothetical protein